MDRGWSQTEAEREVMKLGVWLTLGVCGLGACAGAFSQVGQVVTSLPAREAEKRLEEVFEAYQIPVKERSPDGRVSSGRFDPKAFWGHAVESRVLCRGAASDHRVTVDYLEVLGTIRQAPSRPVFVEIESYGSGRDPDGKVYPCRLDQVIVEQMLKEIPSLRRTG